MWCKESKSNWIFLMHEKKRCTGDQRGKNFFFSSTSNIESRENRKFKCFNAEERWCRLLPSRWSMTMEWCKTKENCWLYNRKDIFKQEKNECYLSEMIFFFQHSLGNSGCTIENERFYFKAGKEMLINLTKRKWFVTTREKVIG